MNRLQLRADSKMALDGINDWMTPLFLHDKHDRVVVQGSLCFGLLSSVAVQGCDPPTCFPSYFTLIELY
jgi:hypothetical protein